MSILWTYNKKIIYNNCWWNEGNMAEEDGGDREQCGRITSRNERKYHIMTVSEWHKIENDGDPWQPTCWLQMAHNDDEDFDHKGILYHGYGYRSICKILHIDPSEELKDYCLLLKLTYAVWTIDCFKHRIRYKFSPRFWPIYIAWSLELDCALVRTQFWGSHNCVLPQVVEIFLWYWAMWNIIAHVEYCPIWVYIVQYTSLWRFQTSKYTVWPHNATKTTAIEFLNLASIWDCNVQYRHTWSRIAIQTSSTWCNVIQYYQTWSDLVISPK